MKFSLTSHKDKVKKQIMSIVICFTLVFSIVSLNTMQSYAIAPVLGGEALASAFLTALGFEGIQQTLTPEQIAEFTPQIYSDAPESVKEAFVRTAVGVEMGKALVKNSFGMADVTMKAEDYAIVKDWITDYFPDYYGTTPTQYDAPTEMDWMNTGDLTPSQFTAQLVSDYDAQIALGRDGVQFEYSTYDSDGDPYADFQVGFTAPTVKITMYYSGGIMYAVILQDDGSFTNCYKFQGQIYTDGRNPSYNNYSVYNGSSSSSVLNSVQLNPEPSIQMPLQKVTAINGLVDVYLSDTDRYGEHHYLGTVSSVEGFEYLRNNLYDIDLNPMLTNIDGDVTFKMPLGTVNFTDNKLDVLPEEITMQSVIDGYTSIQDYLDAGNSIVLADGTVITGNGTFDPLRDLTRDSAPPVAGGTNTDVDGWLAELPIIGGILGSMSGKLTDLRSWAGNLSTSLSGWFAGVVGAIADLANPFKLGDGGGSNPLNGLFNFFAVLLALLIAIMGLIAKVVVFIGELYTIPPSTAMMHPTFVQGLEWARGFDSQTGVNLYGLITGVISIVLGIVVFKLIRKVITGIGTADTGGR